MALRILTSFIIVFTVFTINTSAGDAAILAYSAEHEFPHKLELVAYPSGCGLQVNTPHPSDTTPHQIHARSESFCFLPLQVNRVEMWLYRSRWWGWEQRGHTVNEARPPSSTVQRLRTTVVADCEPGTRHRWRAIAWGQISTGVQSYAASVYEQNDSEIRCP